MLGAVLVLENSTAQGSVALLGNGSISASTTFSARDAMSGVRTEGLAPAVHACLAHAGFTAANLAAVVCDGGPGGFTSLRCAAAVAKGLCSALAIPLYTVPSLELLAWSADLCAGNYVVALSAGRGEWFCSIVRCNADGDRDIGPLELLSEGDLRTLISSENAKLVGPGLDIDVYPSAAAALKCIDRIEAAGSVSLDYWEPAYGRLAEAQVKWEAAHSRPLPT